MTNPEPAIARPQDSPGDGAPTIRRLGATVAAVGCVALVVATVLGKGVSGAVVSASLFSVIVGLVLLNPTLLQDGTRTDGAAAVSTMRVAVLLVVSTFTLVTVKAGWSAGSLADLKLDTSWAWVLAAALGGKALQSFAEAAGSK